jgi:hypothetical protein
MVVREAQRKLQQGKNDEQGVPWQQAAKDEALWIEKRGGPSNEIGKEEAERKGQGKS